MAPHPTPVVVFIPSRSSGSLLSQTPTQTTFRQHSLSLHLTSNMRFNTITGLGLATLSVVVAVPVNDLEVRLLFSLSSPLGHD